MHETIVDLYRQIAGETFDSLSNQLSSGFKNLPEGHTLVVKSHPDGTGYHTTFKSHIAKDKLMKEAIEYQRKLFISDLRELPLCTYFKTQYKENRFELTFIIRDQKRKINEVLCTISDQSIDFQKISGDFYGSGGINAEEIYIPAAGIICKSLERIVDFAPHIRKGLEFK